MLAAGRRAALAWAACCDGSDLLELYQPPELDIVCYFPLTGGPRLSAIDAASARLLADGMADPRPVFLSARSASRGPALAARHPAVAADTGQGRILRSVLMKPESEDHVAGLHARVEELAARGHIGPG